MKAVNPVISLKLQASPEPRVKSYEITGRDDKFYLKHW